MNSHFPQENAVGKKGFTQVQVDTSTHFFYPSAEGITLAQKEARLLKRPCLS